MKIRLLRLLRLLAGKEDISDGYARSACGKAASLAGVGINALLFAAKGAVGLLSGSVAITADAFNNLTDASSSVVSLLGFKLAEKPADAEHPYGHGRFEYLSALLVAVMVMVIGVELMKSSVEKILSPAPVALGAAPLLVLLLSIAAKLVLARMNRRIGERIGSGVLLAAAQDSRSDIAATAVVLLSMIIGHFTGLMLDGWMGAAVALFILAGGFRLVKETVDPLLGSVPDRARVDAIRDRIMSYPGVLGVHDLMVHDYGPGRQFASVHVEMAASEDPLASHALLDEIERSFLQNEGLHLVIHYDPVATDDPRLPVLRAFIGEVAAGIHPRMTIHDLRLVSGGAQENIIFDCVMPYDLDMPVARLRGLLTDRIREAYPGHACAITFERSYISGAE